MNPNMVNDPQGGAGDANPQTSPPGAPTSVDLEAFVAALVAHPKFASAVKEQALPIAQSQKDRRFDKLEKQQADQKSELDRVLEYMEKGMSKEDAKFRVNAEDALATLTNTGYQPQSAPQAALAPQPQAPKAEAADPRWFGLDPSDPVVTKMYQEGRNTVADFLQLAKERTSRTTTPTAAAVLPSAGAPPPRSDEDIDVLTQRVNALMSKPGKTMAEVKEFRELSAKLKAKLQG